MTDDQNPTFALIRALKDAVAVCLRNGWSVEQTRSSMRERAARVAPQGDHPGLSLVRNVLDRAIDEALVRTLQQLQQEA